MNSAEIMSIKKNDSRIIAILYRQKTDKSVQFKWKRIKSNANNFSKIKIKIEQKRDDITALYRNLIKRFAFALMKSISGRVSSMKIYHHGYSSDSDIYI